MSDPVLDAFRRRQTQDDARTGELGVLSRPDGRVSDELSITVTDSRLNTGRPTNIPLLVRGQRDVPALLAGNQVTDEQQDFAIERARERVSGGAGLPFFRSIPEAVEAAGARSRRRAAEAPQATDPVLSAFRKRRDDPDPGFEMGTYAAPLQPGLTRPSERAGAKLRGGPAGAQFRGPPDLPVTTEVGHALGRAGLAGRAALSGVGAMLATVTDRAAGSLRQMRGPPWPGALEGLEKSAVAQRQKAVREWTEYKAAAKGKYAPSPSVSAGVFQPDSMRWWIANITEIAPQYATQLALLLASGGATKVVQFLAFASPVAIQEGGNTFNEAYGYWTDKGLSEEDAARNATIEGIAVATVNTAAEFAPFKALLDNPVAKRVFAANINKLIPKFITRAATVGASEGLTEIVQEAASDTAAYMRGDSGAFEGWEERYKAVGALGAVGGAGMGLSFDVALRPTEPSVAPTVLEMPQEPAPESGPKQDLDAVIAERRVAEPPTEPPQAAVKAPERPVGPPEPPEPPITIPESAQEPDLDVVAAGLVDRWIGERQVAETRFEIRAREHKRQLAEVLGLKRYGERPKRMAAAVNLYIDLIGQAQQEITAFEADLSNAQVEILQLSQNLPAEVQALADQIIAENAEMGVEALGEEVIQNVIENYNARLWRPKARERGPRQRAKFRKTTPRARPRVLSSILQGWALGKELAVPDAIDAQLVAAKDVAQVIQDKKLVRLGLKVGALSTEQQEGFRRVEHPNFTGWKFRGTVETKPELARGRGFLITEKGAILEKVPLYAEAKMARHLNNALGSSALYQVPGIGTITKYNAILKQTILLTAFFHHQAYLRSYMFASKGLNPVKAYRIGEEAIRNFIPHLQELVRGGITVYKSQDIDILAARQKTLIGEVIDKVPMARETKAGILALRDNQLEFLFERLGPNLKVAAALLEYRARLKANDAKLRAGKITRHDIAKAVATLINDDFGGLNLQRMGRNPTTQHIFQLLALAPDWTESNVRMMVKAFAKGEVGKIARRMWARVFLKAGGATIIFNLLLSGFDDETFWERQQAARETGNLRLLDVDVTPVYRALGGTDGKRKYFSILGHFRDVVKFLVHPIRSAKHKSSVLSRFVLEAVTGEDWAGRRFTTMWEALGMDDKGVYRTTREGKYEEGDPKGGRLKGKLVTWGGSGPVELEQVPSFLLHTARGWAPIPVQQGMAFLAGEIDAFDAITKSLGMMTATSYPKKKPNLVSTVKALAQKDVPPALAKELRGILETEGISYEQARELLRGNYQIKRGRDSAYAKALRRLKKVWRVTEKK